MNLRKKRAYIRKGGGHRIVPVWKEKFDEQEFARILLLLAMHLDETDEVVHKKGQELGDGGGHHE